MRIPSISSYNSYKVAKKIIQLKHSSQQVKAVCVRSYQKTPAKTFIPSAILAFQALYLHVLPFKLPKISLKNRITLYSLFSSLSFLPFSPCFRHCPVPLLHSTPLYECTIRFKIRSSRRGAVVNESD